MSSSTMFDPTASQRFGGPVIALSAGPAAALVALQGAQVLSFTISGEELLWLSPQASLSTGKAVRGGIPICWPWFGAHATDAGLPAHGFARTARWQLSGGQHKAEPAHVVLELDSARAAPYAWPGCATAHAAITLSPTQITVAVTTRNSGPKDLLLTQALHSYLKVGAVREAAISGLEHRRYLDQLTGRTCAPERTPLRIAGEVDRIYLDTPETVSVRDSHGGRTLTIAKSGSLSTVIWNPWSGKAERLGDFGPQGFEHMLCVEAANAASDAVRLPPGATHTLATTIALADSAAA